MKAVSTKTARQVRRVVRAVVLMVQLKIHDQSGRASNHKSFPLAKAHQPLQH
jgi:hypothetical protein